MFNTMREFCDIRREGEARRREIDEYKERQLARIEREADEFDARAAVYNTKLQELNRKMSEAISNKDFTLVMQIGQQIADLKLE